MSLTPRPRRARGVWGLLALVVGVGAGVAVMNRQPRPAPVVAPMTVPPPPAVETPRPPPRPTTATVRISLRPAGRVYLDGKPAGTGGELAIPDVPFGPHVLRLEAAGHLPQERTVTVSEPLALAIVLEPRRPPRKPVPKHTRPGQKETDVEAPINPYRR